MQQVDQSVEKSETATNKSLDGTETLTKSDQSDPFEENFKELKKWVDVKSMKYCMLLVVRERRCRRLGTALKVNSAEFFFPITYFRSFFCCNCIRVWWMIFLNFNFENQILA